MALRVVDDETETFRQVQRREHPCRQLLDQIAQGHKPTGAELAALVDMAPAGDRDRVRDRLAEVTVELHRQRNAGALAQCRAVAKAAAFELAPLMGPYRPPREDLSQLSPRELADRIGRGPSALGPPRR